MTGMQLNQYRLKQYRLLYNFKFTDPKKNDVPQSHITIFVPISMADRFKNEESN